MAARRLGCRNLGDWLVCSLSYVVQTHMSVILHLLRQYASARGRFSYFQTSYSCR
jgi:hypothetical protein